MALDIFFCARFCDCLYGDVVYNFQFSNKATQTNISDFSSTNQFVKLQFFLVQNRVYFVRLGSLSFVLLKWFDRLPIPPPTLVKRVLVHTVDYSTFRNMLEVFAIEYPFTVVTMLS